MQKKFLWLVLGLYLVSAIGSFGAFSYFVPTTTMRTSESTTIDGVEEPTLLASLLTINPSDPRDQACPLSGAYYTQQERAAWEKRRPLAVMIENSPDARPQSGLSQADVMFEVMAEGGVTRFMGIFYCGVQANDTILAPVRSARTYFVDYASGFNLPLYVHVGGAHLDGPTDALGQIEEYGWARENDLDQFGIPFPIFAQNKNRIKGKKIAIEL